MNVLFDTPVWSALFRRNSSRLNPIESSAARVAADIISEGRARIIGPIRQELLSGVRDHAQFERLRQNMRSFPDEAITTDDFEQAAEFYNTCRSRDVSGTAIDLLICAFATRAGLQILTLDRDFEHYARILPIRLLNI